LGPGDAVDPFPPDFTHPSKPKGHMVSVFKISTVVGLGLVGPQIAVVLAQGSERLQVYDRDPAVAQRAIVDMRDYVAEIARHDLLIGDPDEVLARIQLASTLDEAVAGTEFVLEAISESLDAKQELYRELDRITPPEITIASNTSTIPIRHMAEVCAHPGRVVGSHFYLPAHILPLVEVIKHPHVDEEHVSRTYDAWAAMGKVPIMVNTDIVGFVANRLQHSLTRQAIELAVDGVASVEDIDTAVRFGFGARFLSLGPLASRDLGGIKNHAKVASYLYHELDANGDTAVRRLQEMSDRGDDGLRTLKGFYDWEGDPEELRSYHYERMIEQTKRLREIGGVRTSLAGSEDDASDD